MQIFKKICKRYTSCNAQSAVLAKMLKNTKKCTFFRKSVVLKMAQRSEFLFSRKNKQTSGTWNTSANGNLHFREGALA